MVSPHLGCLCQVLPELLRLNPRMTEKEATRGAQLDADGMLINWNLKDCNGLDVLPECESYLSLLDDRLPEWLWIVLTCPPDISHCTSLQSLPPSN